MRGAPAVSSGDGSATPVLAADAHLARAEPPLHSGGQTHAEDRGLTAGGRGCCESDGRLSVDTGAL